MKFNRLHAIVLACSLPLIAATGSAAAKGCVKGAVVGGVVGHVAGKHGVAGAAAGCAINHHRENVKARSNAAAGNAAPSQTRTADDAASRARETPTRSY